MTASPVHKKRKRRLLLFRSTQGCWVRVRCPPRERIGAMVRRFF